MARATSLAPDQVATLKEVLADARARTFDSLTKLKRGLADIVEAAAASNLDDEHDPEGATVGFERAQVAALIGAAEGKLGEIDDAIARLEDGSYGLCERCDEPISFERLLARPGTASCVGCAARDR